MWLWYHQCEWQQKKKLTAEHRTLEIMRIEDSNALFWEVFCIWWWYIYIYNLGMRFIQATAIHTINIFMNISIFGHIRTEKSTLRLSHTRKKTVFSVSLIIRWSWISYFRFFFFFWFVPSFVDFCTKTFLLNFSFAHIISHISSRLFFV